MAVVSALGFATTCVIMGLILARAMGQMVPYAQPIFVVCQAPVLLLACTLPLVLSTLLREHEAQTGGRAEALALAGRVASLKAAAARALLAQGIVGIATYDFNAQTSEIIAPPSAMEIFGLSGDRIVTLLALKKRLMPSSATVLEGMLREILGASTPNFVASCEIEVLHPLRGRRLIGCFGSRVNDPQGMPTRITGAIIDITDKRAAHGRVLYTAQLAKLGQVAAGVAHELRQPLNAIKIGLANVSRKASSGALNPEQIVEGFARLARYVERANSIIEAIRKLAHGPSDQQIRLDAGAAIQDALVLQTESARLNGVEISVRLSADMMIMGDPARLEQVIFNLVSNAVYAVSQRLPHRKGAVLVELSPRTGADEIEIVVADNGPGIAPEVEARLFQAFNTNKPSTAGTGLGLSIVHSIIVTEFGGSITATSSPEGARFVIRIPRAAAVVHHSLPSAAGTFMAA